MSRNSAERPASRAAGTPGELVTLADGASIFVRPIEPADKLKLVEGFDRLSRESRYRRFLAPVNRLSPRLVKYLTEVDHYDHEAIVAVDADTGDGVGVARYIRVTGEPDTAEVAVAVVDDWQRRGVATQLLIRLAQRAQECGIERFCATTLGDNRAVLDLLEEVPGARVRKVGSGLVEVDASLPSAFEPAGALRAALRHAASGTLEFRHPAEVRSRRRRAARSFPTS